MNLCVRINVDDNKTFLTLVLTCWLESIVGLSFTQATLLMVAAWLSGSALVWINEVTLRRARLVLGWMTVCGRVNHLGLWPSTQANSAFYPQRDGKWLPARNAATLCIWGVKACVVHSTSGWACGWQVKLCDPSIFSLTRTIPECLRGELLMVKPYKNGTLL